MKLTITNKKSKGLLILSALVIPFACLVFYMIGGRGMAKGRRAGVLGLNTQLPAPPMDWQKAFQDKLKTYEKADNDSLRKEQYRRQDPYRRDSGFDGRIMPAAKRPAGMAAMADTRAEQLEQQLARLQQTLHPAPAVVPATPMMPHPVPAAVMREHSPGDRQAPDVQLDRINTLLEKVIRIQHPEERAATSLVGSGQMPGVDEVLPADSSVNSIAAIVPADQTLTAGTTLALRLTDPIRVEGRTLPAGQLVYGEVTINNDRLLVHIASLREDRNLFATDWQVYDLDGLAGMHIPGLLGREVAKQSADQGVNALNVLTLDPSLGAQAAGAGIQAAKNFLGRKVRQVRVTVRAGYQVLLRNPRADARPKGLAAADVFAEKVVRPPDWEREAPVLARSRNAGMEVMLRTVSIRDSYLWFGLEWRNHSPIGYAPAYTRWFVRDRRAFRRTAVQEQALEPTVSPEAEMVSGDSTAHGFTGFRPFALSRDKELVVDIGEKGGGRALELIIHHQQILKARTDAKASQ